MTLALTRAFPLTAASNSITDIMTALITHFTAAPGLWEMNGVTPVAGAAFAIREKLTPASHIAIRRTTTTGFAVKVAPGLDITSVGSATVAATGGVECSPECAFTMSGTSPRFIVIEHSRAITILFLDTGLTHTPQGIHAGRCFTPARANDATFGMTGHACLVGVISSSAGSGRWFSTSASFTTSRVKTPGVGAWAFPSLEHGVETTPQSYSSTPTVSNFRSVRPLPVLARAVAGGSDNLFVGLTDYFGSAPFITSVLPASQPLSRLESSLTESWLYVKSTAGTTGLVFNWERTISPT